MLLARRRDCVYYNAVSVFRLVRLRRQPDRFQPVPHERRRLQHAAADLLRAVGTVACGFAGRQNSVPSLGIRRQGGGKRQSPLGDQPGRDELDGNLRQHDHVPGNDDLRPTHSRNDQNRFPGRVTLLSQQRDGHGYRH